MKNFFLALLSIALLSGCTKAITGYGKELQEYNTLYSENDCSSEFIEDRINSNDNILLWSELGGSLKRKCKDYNKSNTYFDGAEKCYKEEVDLENAGEKAAKAVGTTLTNENIVDYKGNVFEAIMVNTYKGLNFMSLGKPDLARVEFNRALDRQRRAKLKFKNEIKKKQKEIEEKEEGKKGLADRKKSIDFVKEKYAQGLFKNFQAYPDFINPFTTYMAGLFYLSNKDYKKARDLFKESVAMDPKNKVIASDFRLANELSKSGKSKKKYIWLVYENGKAMQKEEFRVDLPVFLVSSEVMYTGIALPTLEEGAASYRFLKLNDKGTKIVSDMDRVVKTEFKNKLPGIITKAVIRTVTKTVIQAQVAKRNQVAGIGVGAYNFLTNKADVRSWVSLPKNFQSVRVKNEGTATIKTDSGEILESIDVPKDKNAILYISSSIPGYFVVHKILF